MADGVEYLRGFDGKGEYLAARRVLGFDAGPWESWLRTCVAAWGHRQHDARERTQALLMRAQHELNRLERAARQSRKAEHDTVARVDDASLGRARTFVERVAALLAEHAKTGLNLPGRGATPETLTRPGRFDPVQRLAQRGVLDAEQLRAAIGLQELVEKMVGHSGSRAISHNLGGGSGGIAESIPAEIAEAWSLCYVPWSHEQHRLQAYGARHLQLTLDVVIWHRGTRDTAARHRIGRHRAYEIIAASLDDWLDVTSLDRREKWDRRFLAMAEARATAPIKSKGVEA